MLCVLKYTKYCTTWCSKIQKLTVEGVPKLIKILYLYQDTLPKMYKILNVCPRFDKLLYRVSRIYRTYYSVFQNIFYIVKVYASIVQQEVAFFDKTKTGELINRLSADSQLVSQTVTQQVQ